MDYKYSSLLGKIGLVHDCFLILIIGIMPIEPPSGCKWFKSKQLYWIHSDLAQRGLNMAEV